jgi:hypothetical protein
MNFLWVFVSSFFYIMNHNNSINSITKLIIVDDNDKKFVVMHFSHIINTKYPDMWIVESFNYGISGIYTY